MASMAVLVITRGYTEAFCIDLGVKTDWNPLVEDMLARAKQERQAGKPSDEFMDCWVEAMMVDHMDVAQPYNRPRVS